jgi:signal peptidase II
LIDRVHLSYVVDFLHFHVNGHQFPAFNVADSAICTGVGLYILTQLLPAGSRDAGGSSPSGAAS